MTDLREADNDVTWMCGAFQPPTQYQRAVYRCTEPDGHEGSHRAKIDGETVAAWLRPKAPRDVPDTPQRRRGA